MSLIVKIEDYYLEWSTICDAPTTFGMKIDEFETYYKWMYGQQGMEGFSKRMARVEKYGSSSLHCESTKDTVSGNRAGPNESFLTIDEIYIAYCLRKPVLDHILDDEGVWRKQNE